MNDSTKSWRSRLSGLMLTCLLASLTACGTLPAKQTFVLPDAHLYEAPVEVPAPPVGRLTNAALSKWSLELIAALGLANADRAGLAAWAKQLGAPAPVKGEPNGN